MKAVLIDQFGGREVLRMGGVEKPEPRAGELLIRVCAAGINPVDWKIRQGLLVGRLPHVFPLILGWDAAGIVEALGPGCTRFRAGDEVFVYGRKPVIGDGCYAEYVVIPESYASRMPKKMNFEEAASIPLACLTAWQSLFDASALKKGMTVLIHAAAGGVGGFAVQLAKSRGADVVGTASARNHDYVRSLGADLVIDYTSGDFRSAVRRAYPDGVDIAFDTVGGAVQAQSADVIKPGGVLVSLLAYANEAALQAKGIRTKYVFVSPNGSQLEDIRSLIDQGQLKTHLAAVLSLDQVAKAHELVESGHTRGKIVLKID